MHFLQIFEYAFIIRALLAGSFVALLCASLGVLLVLRRLSLIGDGLSHVTFGSVALGLLLRVEPIYVSIPIVGLSSLAILKIQERARLYSDAAIGIVSAVGVSGGVLLAGVGSGFNVDLFSYLFGNILSVTTGEVVVSVTLSLIVLLVIVSLYSQILSMSFDEEFARMWELCSPRPFSYSRRSFLFRWPEASGAPCTSRQSSQSFPSGSACFSLFCSTCPQEQP
jgi:zinc transport system permease protein